MKQLELLLPPPVIALISGLMMWLIARLFPSMTVEWLYQPAIAALLVLLGLAVGLIGIAAFIRSKTTGNPKQPNKTTKLVRSGIYRLSRNPMYLGMLLMLIAWGMYLNNIASVICIITYIALITRLQIMPEERVLEEKFGEEYLSYKRKVRRWL